MENGDIKSKTRIYSEARLRKAKKLNKLEVIYEYVQGTNNYVKINEIYTMLFNEIQELIIKDSMMEQDEKIQ